MRSVAVIGASLAGLRAAQALRAQGFDGELTIVGAEAHLPYDRPPLSKDFLAGRSNEAALALVDDEDVRALDARWRLGVHAKRLHRPKITLSDGTEETADGLVVGAVSSSRTPPPWFTSTSLMNASVSLIMSAATPLKLGMFGFWIDDTDVYAR